MSGLINHLSQVPVPIALAVIAALVFAEAAVFVGFVLPGETAVLIGGVLASAGMLSLPLLVAVVVIAAVLGDSVGYQVGCRLGPKVLAWRPLLHYRARLDSAQESLRERGGWAIFLGRFTAFLRAVMPGLAGVSQMPYRRFLAFNFVGGLVWGVGLTLLGYAAGQSYERVAAALSQFGIGVMVVLLLALLIALRTRGRGAHAQQPWRDAASITASSETRPLAEAGRGHSS